MSQALPLPELVSDGALLAEVRGRLGILTLHRPGALNALTLPMVRDMTTCLLHWLGDDHILGVLVRGAGREGKPPAFCAGGDIRFFHQGALAGDPRVEDFFTEEYALNHLIHHYGKPYIALMDGVCMGGGMGISQGGDVRVVTEFSKLAMPETLIGLFPDVGGGWFLSRCEGHLGEYLALTGETLGAADAIAAGWADLQVPSASLPGYIERLAADGIPSSDALLDIARSGSLPEDESALLARQEWIDGLFSRTSLSDIVEALRSDTNPHAAHVLSVMAKRSPLMMAVALEQVRRARHMTLAEDLRMERDLMRNCLHLRPGTASESLEGIRALVIDKDHQPRWNPTRVDDVAAADVLAYFNSPWPEHVHPLRELE